MKTADSLTLSEFVELASASQYLVIDTEGDARDLRGDPKAKTMGITLTFRMGRNLYSDYFPIKHKIGTNITDEDFKLIRDLIEHHPCLVFHNAKHDLLALANLGIDVTKSFFYCTMLMSHWNNEHELNYALDFLSKKHGGEPKAMPASMAATIAVFGWEYVDAHDMRLYSRQDGYITYELFEKVLPEFKRQGFDTELWVEMQDFIRTITMMECAGVEVDTELCEVEIEHAAERMEDIVYDLKGLVPSRPTDLETLLIKQLGLPVLARTKTGKISFAKEVMKKYDEEYLQPMNSPVAKMIRAYRGFMKTKATNYEAYLRCLSPDGRLRPNYNFHRTKTSRLSCGSDSDGKTEVASPNLQNIPRKSENEWDGELKKAFVPKTGYKLWDLDYAQLELRIIAAYSKEPALIEAFAAGRDLFDEMSAELGWDRQDLKTFVYAINYGAGPNKIKNSLGISYDEAVYRIEQFKSTYPQIHEFMQKVINTFERRGYIKLWTGRRCHYTGSRKYAAFNYVIQGGGAEIVKRAMNRIRRAIDWDECSMLLQVHDSVVLEIKEDTEDKWLPVVKEIMEDVPEVFKHVSFSVDAKIWGT